MEGDSRYSAPELLNLDPDTSLLHKADIFAFGMVLLQLLTGKEPPSQGELTIVFRNPKSISELLAASGSSQVLQGIVKACLHENPAARPEALELQSTVLQQMERLEKTRKSGSRLLEGYSSLPSGQPTRFQGREGRLNTARRSVSRPTISESTRKPRVSLHSANTSVFRLSSSLQ